MSDVTDGFKGSVVVGSGFSLEMSKSDPQTWLDQCGVLLLEFLSIKQETKQW